jgi:hypothetical protein
MKNIAIALSACLFLSCSASILSIEDIPLSFNNIDEIWQYTSSIEYKTREDGVYYWQLPKETFNKNSGICADYCIMFQYLAEKAGYDVSILLMTDGTFYHSIIKYNDMFIEPQIKGSHHNMDGWDIKKELHSYDETLAYKINVGY